MGSNLYGLLPKSFFVKTYPIRSERYSLCSLVLPSGTPSRPNTAMDEFELDEKWIREKRV
jgi:hypothetical protein